MNGGRQIAFGEPENHVFSSLGSVLTAAGWSEAPVSSSPRNQIKLVAHPPYHIVFPFFPDQCMFQPLEGQG